MRKVIFFLLFVNSMVLFGQPDSKWGPVLENPIRKSKHMWIASEDSSNIYIIKRRYFLATTTWFLEAINKKSKAIIFLKALVPPLDENKKRTDFNEIISFGSKLYVLSTGYKKSGNKLTLYATSINKLTGFKEETKAVYYTTTENESKKILFTVSPDGSNILIYPSPYDDSKDELKLMNRDFGKLWSDKLIIDGSDSKGKKITVGIDNIGNIIIYCSTVKTLMLFSTLTSEGREIKVSIPKGTVNYSSLIRIVPNGDAYFLLMLHPENQNITWGFMHTFINLKTQELQITKTTFLDTVQIKEILGKNIGPKWKEYGLYYIKDIFLRQDDVILIGEQSYAEITHEPIYYYLSSFHSSYSGNPYLGYKSSGFSHVIIEHKVNLISVFSLAFSGDLNWVKVIPKNQSHPNYNYLSYVANCNEQGVYLIYNDNFSNVNQKPEFGPVLLANPKRGVGVAAFINNKGQLKLDDFYRINENNHLIIKPGLSFSGSNSIYLFTENRNRFRIGELLLH